MCPMNIGILAPPPNTEKKMPVPPDCKAKADGLPKCIICKKVPFVSVTGDGDWNIECGDSDRDPRHFIDIDGASWEAVSEVWIKLHS